MQRKKSNNNMIAGPKNQKNKLKTVKSMNKKN